MRLRSAHRALFVATAAATLAFATPSGARAEEATAPARAPTTPSIWPAVLAAGGVALAASTTYFYVQYQELETRGERLAPQVPRDEAPCTPGGNEELCAIDKRARLASTMTQVSALASLGLFASAIAVYVIDHEPKKKTAVVPLAGPSVAGAALVSTF